MQFNVEGRSIRQNNTRIGIQRDTGVDTMKFVLDRYAGETDLSLGIAYLLFVKPSGGNGYAVLTKKAEGQKLTLSWKIGGEAMDENGILRVQLKISGLDGELWHSETSSFYVTGSLSVETPVASPVRMLAANGPMLRTATPDSEPPITISERTINIPTALQNIAVQNDQNSETVTILCPRYFDGTHDLSKYVFYLRTVSSNGYDPVLLHPVVSETELRMEWTLRPPQTSYNGKLTIQLWVTGKDFDWQTAEASVNIIRQIGGEPVIPVTPSILDEFLKELTEIAENASISESNAAGSAAQAKQSENAAASSADTAKSHKEAAAQSAQAAAESAAGVEASRDQAHTYQLEAAESAKQAAASKADAESAKDTARVYRDESQAFSGAAQTAAQNAITAAQDAAGAKDTAADEADRAKREADRSGAEADRSKTEADRAQNIANLWFTNPHTGQLDLLQSILNENFGFLFDLIRKLHNLGLTWRQINEKGLTWRQINELHFTWREINVLGITASKIAAIRNTLLGR